ncbi:MAG TPA: M14 family metallopeptidase, partial [Myxococcota bacterium]
LNRNFPVPDAGGDNWIVRNISRRFGGSGSSDKASSTFRGDAPLSEPEARAVDALCVRERFTACASLHSFMGTCIPPCVRTAAESRAYADLARAFIKAQRRTHYVRFANRTVDVLTGELEDRLHHDLGCWAMTIECFSIRESIAQHMRAPSLFWRFNPRAPDAIVHDDVAGVLAFCSRALDLPHPRRALASTATA